MSGPPYLLRFGADLRPERPYQTRLYGAACPLGAWSAASVRAATDEVSVTGPAVIYHLHTEAQFLGGETPAVRQAAAQELLDALDNFRASGGRLVWTRHAVPDLATPAGETHASVLPHLTAMADLVHVHGRHALAAVTAESPIEPHRTAVLPAGPEDDPAEEQPRDSARAALGLPEGGQVFLLPEQAHAEVLAAFAEIDAPDARLLVSGAVATEDARVMTVPMADAESRARALAAADTVVFANPTALSVPAALKAMGAGRAPLGPVSPGLLDLVWQGQTGLLYDPADPRGMERALRVALREGPEVWRKRGRAAQTAAGLLDWGRIGRQWHGLFLTLHPERRRVPLAAAARIEPAE